MEERHDETSPYIVPGVVTILREPDVLAAFGGGRTRMYEEIEAGKWPAPIRTGKKAKGWYADEIAEAQERRRKENRIQPGGKKAMSPHLKKAIKNSVKARQARARKKARAA